jgi:hypothetical protein
MCFLFIIYLLWFITVKYERIKFLVIALKNAVEIYAWAPKPYHKFMAFKVSRHLLGCFFLFSVSTSGLFST